PFTCSYARTKIRAWVLRTECRWIRATIPDDEERRIASLRELKILDTEPEERFDRITRLAAALFNVPMAVFCLVYKKGSGSNRAWGFMPRRRPGTPPFLLTLSLAVHPWLFPTHSRMCGLLTTRW